MPPSLTHLFNPRSIAVVGASRNRDSIGWQVVDNLVRHGFRGGIYPVNPETRAVHSVPAWRSVREIPSDVDLAVVVVPFERVIGVIDDCGAMGVPAVIVISAGFAEAGPEGARREQELVERVRRYGMRMVGPNCMGVLNTDPAVSMNATFAPTMPPPGPVSFLSQSGSLGVTILDYAAEYGIGIRHFVSVGNKPDVSGNDLLEHWETDPETRVILMYLETFGNPGRFTRIARRLGRRKPIVVVTSGRTGTRARAASSRSDAPAGAPRGSPARGNVAVEALLAQCGLHRADTVEELFDLAMAFGSLPIPRSNRVAIVTNAGGPGIIIADACEERGLEVVELSPETRGELAGLFREKTQVHNPVHMVATTTPESYLAALQLVLSDPGVDAAIAAFVPPLGARQPEVARSIVEAARAHPGTPVLAVLMGREGLPEGRAQLQAAGIPAYIFPESAARALAALHRHGRWLERPVQAPTTFPVCSEEVGRLLSTARSAGHDRLGGEELLAVLTSYGIPAAPRRCVTSEDDASAAAREIGFPVALRLVSPQDAHDGSPGLTDRLLHGTASARASDRTVIRDVRDPEELRRGYNDLIERAEELQAGSGLPEVLVAPFPREGKELILGMTRDPTFGPVLMVGLGGVHAETLRDVAFGIPPVTEWEAREMVRSLRSFPMLEDVTGKSPQRVDAIVEALQRLSQLVQEQPGIAELDVDPLLVTAGEVAAIDGRIRLEVPLSQNRRMG